jgi:hypothetical protein
MKFTIVTQWVKIPPVQSLASRTVANPAGQPGNGSPKPGGARVQAAGLSPEMSIVVDRKDNLGGPLRGNADAVHGAEGRNPGYAKARYAGFHRGLRAGHGVTGGTRELGRATCLLGIECQKSRGTGGPRALAVADSFQLSPSPQGNTNRGSSQGIGERATSEATRDGHGAVVAEHSTRERGEVRLKRPTGGKARPGRARSWEDRGEGL